ncbi:hypothetical protein BpHYR1_000148 [Brachionus plicatilis]|uniref:Uncharacterized protein n=1 Tax=Brachionus plicatilis TaxID=10195 RepID=A0A3M7SCT3_BRAPC|nr:hypothetical protein BpHYR1_000148 [Brachionus plicatilis]
MRYRTNYFLHGKKYSINKIPDGHSCEKLLSKISIFIYIFRDDWTFLCICLRKINTGTRSRLATGRNVCQQKEKINYTAIINS